MKRKIFSVLLTILVMVTMSSVAFAADANGTDATNNFNTGYINPDVWLLRDSDVGKIEVNNGELFFNQAGDGAFFGPKGTYKDLVMAFDLQLFGGSTWCGVQLGADTLEEAFWAPTSNLIYFQSGNTDVLKGGNPFAPTEGSGTDVGGGRAWHRFEFMSEEEDELIINVKLIVKDGSVKVFYKKSTDDAAELNVQRSQFDGMDTAGYVGIVSTAGSNFKIDNLRVLANPDADITAAIADEVDPATIQDTATEQQDTAEDTAQETTQDAATDTTNTTDTEKNPQTSDAGILTYAVMMVSAAGISAAGFKKLLGSKK